MLHYAGLGGSLNVAKWLLRTGASTDARDDDQARPIDLVETYMKRYLVEDNGGSGGGSSEAREEHQSDLGGKGRHPVRASGRRGGYSAPRERRGGEARRSGPRAAASSLKPDLEAPSWLVRRSCLRPLPTSREVLLAPRPPAPVRTARSAPPRRRAPSVSSSAGSPRAAGAAWTGRP